MKEILLLDLIVRNFMGVKLAEIHPEGKDILIIGENETGKTRFATGWNWLLFDKDIYGKSEFDIKWLDENNNVKDPGLEYVVEGTLLVDGTEKTLKKVFYEKWQKKKGSNEKRFTGHTTDYFIDEVPKKKSEYEEEINKIIDEETFKILTDPDYFCGKMHWEDRREVLMDAFGGVSDKEIIEQNDKLEDLLKIIKERDIEDHKEICKSKMKKINKQIEKIPVRIDECSQGMPELPEEKRETIQLRIEKLKEKKKAKEQEMANISNGGGVAEKKKRLAEIDGELQQVKNKHTAEYDDKIQEKKQELASIKDMLDETKRGINNKEQDISDKEAIIRSRQEEMKRLKKDWYELQEEKEDLLGREIRVENKCPTCGQELPEEQIEEAIKKANSKKADKIEKLTEEQNRINQTGLEKKEEVEKLQAEIKDIKTEIEQLNEKYDSLLNQSGNIQDEISELEEKFKAYQNSKDYQDKLKEKEQLKEEINNLKEDNKFSLQKIDKEITVLEEKIESEKSKLNDIKAYEKGQKRIDELKAEERKLAKEYEKLDRQVYLCDEFTKAKVNALEDKINSKFKYTDWKLFNELVNGGIEETCEALYKGVEYNSTLNTGSKILVGIDVINTLSEHYGIRVPVFVDNIESLTCKLESDNQLIKLKAVEGVKELRVEKMDKQMKEAV